jgi:hypothetical protein
MSCCWGEKCALVSVWSLPWSGFAVSESESPLSLSLSLSVRTLICKQPLLCEMCDNLWKNCSIFGSLDEEEMVR